MIPHKTHADLTHWEERVDVELDERLQEYWNGCTFTEPPESAAERLSHQEHDFD